MFHIHIVDRSNRGAYRDQLEQHFRLRHEIYVAERGWLDLERSVGREMDAFDNEDAVYLLGILPGRGVVAGSRLSSLEHTSYLPSLMLLSYSILFLQTNTL